MLLRVQCYEGLDVAQTAYEWNVARQMMEIRLAEAAHDVGDAASRERLAKSLYARSMLIERPLLQALTQARSPVLLIDELDRADEPFDAFLLEVLAENQLTIPELGTVKAAPGAAPIVVITSNRTREIHDALKRRCLYHWVDYPDARRELEIVRIRAPGAPERLCARRSSPSCSGCARSTCSRRPASPRRSTGRNALVALNAISLAPDNVRDTLGVLLKHRDDIAKMQGGDVSQAARRAAGDGARRDAARRAGRCSLTTSSTSRASCATPACRSAPTACSRRSRRSRRSASAGATTSTPRSRR